MKHSADRAPSQSPTSAPKRPRTTERRHALDSWYSLEFLSTLVTEVDASGVVRFANPPLAVQYGVSEGEKLIQWIALGGELFQHKLGRLFISGGRVINDCCEVCLLDTQGVYRPHIASMDAVGAGSGNVRAVLITMVPRPNTPPAESYGALKQFILDRIPQPIFATDTSGRVIFWNASASTAYSVPSQDAMGQRPPSLPAESIGGLIGMDQTHCIGEFAIREADGSVITSRAYMLPPAPDPGPSPPPTALTRGADIDFVIPLKRSSTAVPAPVPADAPGLPPGARSSSSPSPALGDSELAEIAVRKSVASVCIIDARGCIEWVNERFEQTHGVSLPEGLPALPLLQGKHEGAIPAQIKEALEQGKPLSIPITHDSEESAQSRLINLIITPIRDQDSRLLHFTVKEYDITDSLKASEEVLAHKMRVEFFNAVSHELRTPLNSIMGLSSMLLEGPLSDPEEIRRCLSIVMCCSEILLILLNNLIDLRKIETNTLAIATIPFDLNTCISHSVACCNAIALQKSGAVFTHIDPDVPAIVLGDPLRLNQVLVNLISNAIKFAPPARPVHLRISRSLDKNHLVFQVEDQKFFWGRVLCSQNQGIGIPSDRLQRLLSDEDGASFQASELGGAGIGLMICRRLATLMGGRIWATSTLGSGSTFSLSLPLQLPTQEQISLIQEGLTQGSLTPTGSDQKSTPLRIMIVEDNVLNQKVLLKILEVIGFHADVAANGREAIELLTKHQYDLILMDVQMPVMNGLDATRYIVKHWTDSFRPIIVGITANAMTEDINEYIKAGMTDCLMKPITIHKMADVLRAVLQQSQHSRPVGPLRRFSY